MIPSSEAFQRLAQIMMGRQAVDQSQLFYLFNLEEHIPMDHLLRRINPIVTRVLADLRALTQKFRPAHGVVPSSEAGRRPYALRCSGTLPPLSASFTMTWRGSQRFISAEPSSTPVEPNSFT